ncbi:helix-turn-helix domain-containing GNAT family N-acetyltransferase [Rhizobium sp. LjRoot30]|uniref:bifunctional helix-turn-helix transcriptional regulator/GNAT family N-acetyltransferase n=1 Tax=Rhizobium sp. LjRoot30 TaxID=3342320 RepID=UPI003ECC286E
MTETTLDAVRAFNRFYTRSLGVLGKAYLGKPYTLTEARILYELGAHDGLAAADLTRDLHLDPAYLSRILKRFREAGLIESRPHPDDLRSQLLSVTDEGRAEHEDLAQRSRAQIAEQFETVSPQDRESIVAAMEKIRRLLDPDARPAPVVLRGNQPGDIGWVVQSQAEFYTREYGWNDQFEALVAEVAGAFLKNFNPASERCWIAERNGQKIGSIFIANGGDGIAKLRLLYVDPSARGLGLGRMLVEECIRFSRQAGYRQISLWTNDNLTAARNIYLKAGFRLVAEERHRMFGPELNGQTWVLDL